MRNILILGILFLSLSCSSYRYRQETNKGDFSRLAAGERYVFWQKDNAKTRMRIYSVNNDSIVGFQRNERIVLAKKDIATVRKNNTAGTVILASVGTGSIILLGVFFKAIGDIGKGIGKTDPEP